MLEKGCENVNWIVVVQDRIKGICGSPAECIKAGNILVILVTISSSRIILNHGIQNNNSTF
jgi:hypothetical protein